MSLISKRPGPAGWAPSGLFFAAVFVVFSITDLILSLAAFAFRIPEGNPVLGWLGVRGLFVPGKLLFSLVAATLIAVLYQRGRIRHLAYVAIALMASVDAYHVWALNALLARR